MTDHNNSGDAQRFTGAYTTSGAPGYSDADTEKDWNRPQRQDTTFISPATGGRRTFLPGDIIDNTYQLSALLGRGGMGVVFACRHITLGKEYALKLLAGGQLNQEAWSRFQSEAKALARLNHPGIVGIHNMGIETGQYPYYVMDLLSGETLDVLIDRTGPVPINQALDFFIQVCDALSSAHGQGIIHRDIKPSNLMLVRDLQNQITTVKIVDFGIARLSKHEFTTQSQTATGLVFGTPYYMSPEQCQGQKVDERSDIYSLGCTIFEALTGDPPFRGDNAFQTFMLHQTQTTPSLNSIMPRAKFPESLDLAIEKMLAKRISSRYQSMLQVQHDLGRIKAGKPIMAQGLVSAAGQAKDKELPEADVDHRPSVRRPEYRKNYREENQEANAVEDKAAPVLKRALIGIGILAILLSAGGYYLWANKPGAHLAKPAPGQVKLGNMNPAIGILPKTLDITTKEYAGFDFPKANPGALSKDLSNVDESGNPGEDVLGKTFDSTANIPLLQIKDGVDLLKPKLRAFVKQSKEKGRRFKRDGNNPGFQFMDDVSIGAIRVGNRKPVLAMGFVPVPKNSDVCLYLETATSDTPDMLDLFGPDDLTGLQFVWPNPDEALSRAKNWRRLKELSLFNPVIKAPFGWERCDESPLTDNGLRDLNQFTGLRTLGLCGVKISEQAIFDMPVLRSLDTLELKSLRGITSILPKIAQLDNLKELWLVNESTTDDQLEPLTHMKNLATLKILRGRLTPHAVTYLRKMPALKHLHLDTKWTKEQNKKFESDLPNCRCEFEPSVDLTFWVLAKKKK